MTTITHNGKTARINARPGDIISDKQAMRLVKLLGTKKTIGYTDKHTPALSVSLFDDGHQIYRSYSDGLYRLRYFAHLARVSA